MTATAEGRARPELMQALVLVGGFGTRLRPLTDTVPKALMPIANVAFMERMVHYLERHGVTHIVMASGYLPEPIERHFAEHPCSAKIDFVVEESPLGTGGAIKNAEHLLSNQFFVFNGDVLTAIDLNDLLQFHDDSSADATIALTPVEDPTLYGVVETALDGRIQRFLEKPKIEEVTTNYINAGIYVYQRHLLDLIPDDQEFSVEHELYPTLLKKGRPLYGKPFNDYWIDIGTIDKYMRANLDALDRRAGIDLPQTQPNLDLGVRVQLNPPILTGPGCRIEQDAEIGPRVVLGSGVEVGAGARITKAILWDECIVEPHAVVDCSVLGSGCRVREGARTEPMRAYGNSAIIEKSS